MERVKFPPGKQREFMKKILEDIGCPSLREVIQRGIDVPYSTLKNYYAEKRFLPSGLFEDLCHLARVEKDSLNVEQLKDNFGQVLGGKKSKRKKV